MVLFRAHRAIPQSVHALFALLTCATVCSACGLCAAAHHWSGGGAALGVCGRPHAKKGAVVVSGSRPLAWAGVAASVFHHPPAPPLWRGAQLKSIAFLSACAFNNPKSVKSVKKVLTFLWCGAIIKMQRRSIPFKGCDFPRLCTWLVHNPQPTPKRPPSGWSFLVHLPIKDKMTRFVPFASERLKTIHFV